MGASHARLLAARGASVVVADLGGNTEGTDNGDPGPAQTVVEEIRAAGGSAVAAFADVGDPTAAASIVAAAIDNFGRVDIVINNAGNWQYMPFDEYTPEAFQRDLNAHVWGSWNIARAAWSHMRHQGYGRILNTGSDGMLGMTNAAGYCTVKAAMIGFTKALAQEGAPLGINVNAIAPSGATRMGELFPEEKQEWRKMYQTPEMVSAGAAWLVHEDCAETGGIFSCYSGRVASFFVGQVHGWWTEPASITPEHVRANFEHVKDRTHFFVPTDTANSIETATGLIDVPPPPGSLDQSLRSPLGTARG
jgi:hypothetical protein